MSCLFGCVVASHQKIDLQDCVLFLCVLVACLSACFHLLTNRYCSPPPPLVPRQPTNYSAAVLSLYLSLFLLFSCGEQISIHVITNDRLSSLTRLIKSLQESHYLGDVVELGFHIDVDADGAMMDYVMVR